MKAICPLVRFAVVAAVVCVGCDGPKTARITGKITYKNQPIHYGQVTFVGPGGATGVGPIDDGTYVIHSAPRGDVKITVQAFPRGPHVVNPSDVKDKAVGPPAKGEPVVRIPAEYGDAATTKLTFTVTGEATHDIDLP